MSNPTINLLLLLCKYEWKQFGRSKSFLWLTALLLGIGLYAIFYGRNEVKEQQYKIALLKNNIDSLYNVTAQNLQLHDTTASGEYVGRLYANNPDAISALAFGQKDIHKFAQHITNGSYFYNKYASGYVNKTQNSEIINPFKLLAGHLDVSFVFIFLFPLYFILLSYNLLSSEKEAGTLGLIATQPVRISSIIFQKLLFRFLIVASLGILLLLVAGAVNGIIADIRWGWFAVTFIAYIFCWQGIIAVIISFNKDSGFNALSLVSFWILFTLLLPSLLNAALNTLKPISTKTTLSAAVQKANAEAWDLPKQIKIDSFKTLRPYYANSFDSIGSWEDPKYYRLNHYLTDYYIIPFEQKRIENVANRNAFADRLNYFSPALITQAAFNELSGSNMQQMLAYDTLAFNYFKKISRFTDDYIFLKADRFTKNDLNKMPILEFKAVVNYTAITYQVLVLFFAGLAGLIIGFLFTKKIKYS